MDIKQILKSKNISQDEFSIHCGLCRQGLNTNLNHRKQKPFLEHSLISLLLEKQGLVVSADDKGNLLLKKEVLTELNPQTFLQ